MENKKEMTAPNVSVGADTEQSIQKCTDISINDNDENIKDLDESFRVMQREMLRQMDPSYLKTVSMSALYDTDFETQTALIDGLLYQGTYLFVGSPKVGKSFMMAQLAYHISTGTPLWNYRVRNATVLYFALEMEEFMLALGEDDLVEQIKKCFQTDTPLPSALHDAAMQLYRQYLVVGGMPECVMQFAETKDYILVRHTQDTILASYLNDMSKYNNLNEIKKTRLAYDNITVQLSKKNTRFQYKLMKKGGRASEFENAIEWLCLSGIVSQVYKVEQIKKPLENYRDIDAFKIYVSDLGLLCAKKDLAANDILYMVEEINDFKGGMAENYVNVQLTINGYHTYYWESKRGAEIDFIIQRDGQLIPIEVKSADNTRAKSLKVYMDTYKPAYAIKLSAKNFGFEDNKKIVPLYAAFCI